MKQFWNILTLALSIAIALLLYDRFVKPIGKTVFPEGTNPNTSKSLEQQVEEILNKEGL